MRISLPDILCEDSFQIVYLSVDTIEKEDDLTFPGGCLLVLDLHLAEIDFGLSVIGGCNEVSD